MENFMSSEFIVAFISVLGSLFIAYVTLHTPRKNENTRNQLENVFLPLSKLVYFKNINYDENLSNLETFTNEVGAIIERSFIYVPENLYESYTSLNDSIKSDNFENAKQEYTKLISIVDKQYDLLKRRCGLPNKGLISTVKYLKTSEQIILIITSLLCICFILTISYYIFKNMYISIEAPEQMETNTRSLWQVSTVVTLFSLAVICLRYSSKK